MKDMDIIDSGVDYNKAWDAGYTTAKEHYEMRVALARAQIKEKGEQLTLDDALTALEGIV